jgi:hypothetical protein
LEIEREQCRGWRRSAGIDIVQNEVAVVWSERCARACKLIARLLTYLCSSKMYKASMLAIVLTCFERPVVSIVFNRSVCLLQLAVLSSLFNTTIHPASWLVRALHFHMLATDTFYPTPNFPYTTYIRLNHPLLLRTGNRQAWRRTAHRWVRRAQHRLPGSR